MEEERSLGRARAEQMSVGVSASVEVAGSGLGVKRHSRLGRNHGRGEGRLARAS